MLRQKVQIQFYRHKVIHLVTQSLIWGSENFTKILLRYFYDLSSTIDTGLDIRLVIYCLYRTPTLCTFHIAVDF
jgi:hypothetical protein